MLILPLNKLFFIYNQTVVHLRRKWRLGVAQCAEFGVRRRVVWINFQIHFYLYSKVFISIIPFFSGQCDCDADCSAACAAGTYYDSNATACLDCPEGH